MAVVVFVLVSQLAPVAAVRPQEGWYVRDTMTYTVSGVEREYFIIDNKMSADKWYTQLASYIYVLPDPLLMTPDWLQPGLDINWNVLGVMSTYYRGYSDVDWVVDDDFLLLLDWQFSSDSFVNIYFFDKSKVPCLTYDNHSDSYGLVGSIDSLLGRSYTDSTSKTPFGPAPLRVSSNGSLIVRLGGTYQTSTYGRGYVYNPLLTMYGSGRYTEAMDFVINVDGTSINDFCVVAFLEGFNPTVGVQQFLSDFLLSVQFAVPVDKCPAGTQVGDSWPKVKPLEVQMDDAYKAWMDSALQNTPVADSSQVGEQIKDNQAKVEEGDNFSTEVSAAFTGVLPVLAGFTFVKPFMLALVAVLVLLLLIKKGMS